MLKKIFFSDLVLSKIDYFEIEIYNQKSLNASANGIQP